MGYPNFDAAHAANDLARISQWIDDEPANRAMTPLEQLLFRTLVKVGEEEGEIDSALVGMTGQNPRKGFTHTRDDVMKEMLDKALTALAGVEHMTGNRGESMRLLFEHITRIERRMAESRHRHGEPGGVAANG